MPIPPEPTPPDISDIKARYAFDWSSLTYECISAPAGDSMFTVGLLYRGVNGHRQPALLDNRGHERVIGYDYRFPTQRPCFMADGELDVQNDLHGSCLFARFRRLM